MLFRPRSRRPPRSRERPGFTPAEQNWWLLPLMIAFLILYWYIIWVMESISPQAFNQYLVTNLGVRQELPLPFVTILSFVHPRVLRHFIPLAVGWYLAVQATINMVQLLYDLPDLSSARTFLNRLRSPFTLIQRPLVLDGQNLEVERPNYVRLRIGGPGQVTIKTGRVAVTEINGRYHRTLGPGFYNLARFEYVRAVLDLRPQQREAKDINVVTQDGMPVVADLSVVYRISTGGEPISASDPYPYDRDSVRKLAYTEVNTGDKRPRTWEGNALGAVKGQFGKALREFRLDELHASSSGEPYPALRLATERYAREALKKQGIDLVRVRVTRIELPINVAEQYINHWRARMETLAYLTLVDGRASVLEEMEIAQADAELTMIQAIVEGVQRARNEGRVARLNEIVAVRLVEALERLARQTETEDSLPESLLPQIASIQSRLATGEDKAADNAD